MITHETLMQWSARLETGIDKFSAATHGVALSVAKTIERLDAMESKVEQLKHEQATESDQHRTVQANDSRYLNERIDAVQKDLTTKLAEQTKEVTAHFDKTLDKAVEKFTEKHETLAQRVNTLETWRWLIVGGAVVIGFVLSGFFLRIAWVLIENNATQWFPFLK